MSKALIVETWKGVPGWNYYEVSDQGRVRSLDKTVPSKAGSRAIRRGKMLSQTLHRGYPVVRLRDAGRDSTVKVHTLVLEAFTCPRPDGKEARHLDGNRLNNTLENLVWGTKSENNLDRVRHGTHTQASRTHCPQNHEYSEENTYITPSGGRKCRICKRAQFLAFKEREKNG